jgi:hypothetical protein
MFSNLKNPKLPQKIPKKFVCENCDFITSNKKDYNRHTETIKHKHNCCQPNSTTEQLLPPHPPILYPENPKFKCICGKNYKDKSGIWRHKKKCQSILNQTKQQQKLDGDESDYEEYSEEHSTKSESISASKPPSNNEIIEILKVQMLENQELRKFMMDQHKQMMEQQSQMFDIVSKSNVTNNIQTNSNCNNNNTFNLQFFLNEKCKDALNINEFVDSIKIQMSDLENFAHMDYANGISKILLKNFNNLDTYSRPIHCSDSKRETLYIKENNCWTKEAEDKPILKKAIKQVAFKNIKLINEWVKEHPGCQDPTTKQNVKYNKIVMNSMSGGTVEEQHDNLEQIVKNVTKAVVIDKYAVK